MIARVKIKAKEDGGNYFASPKKNLTFIPSGCTTLDLALGGGWATNRIVNIVGDKSTGKTLLCIEASANFILTFPKAWVRYRECESAFDVPYAGALGMPLDRVDFGSNTIETVEDLFKDLVKIIASATTEELVIVDSLDSLSDDAEMQRDMSEGTYGAQKAKNMSQMFRRLVRQLANSKVTLIIVSQVRDKIGAMGYGRKTTRSGGRALDFYASQVVYLAHIEKLTRTIHNIKRATGVHIKAMVDKNKIGLAFRESEFNINFGFGIDDVTACLTWLKEAKYLKDVDISEKEVKSYHETLMKGSRADYDKELAYLQRAVKKRWYELETSFLPTRKKYG